MTDANGQPLVPGFYWFDDGERVAPVEWTGKKWWGIAMQRPLDDDEVVNPIPLAPPSAMSR